MTLPLGSLLQQASDQLGSFLPRLLGALLLLVIGILLARLVAKASEKTFEALGLDELGERWELHDALERVGLPRSLSTVLCRALRIGLTLVVIFAALSLLGLQFLSQSLNEAVLFLPSLLVVGALLLAGVVLSGLARERVDHLTEQMDLPVPLGLFAQATVLAVFVITAAAQIAVSSAILLVLVAIVLAAALGSVGLAFGLGGRAVAEGLNAGRVVHGAFELGQTIEVAGIRGEVIAFEPVATVVRKGAGSTVRIPNHLLVAEPVTIEERGPGPGDSLAEPEPSP